MTKSVRLLLMGAALTGFVAGQNAFAQDTDKKDDTKKTDDRCQWQKSHQDQKRQACLQGPELLQRQGRLRVNQRQERLQRQG